MSHFGTPWFEKAQEAHYKGFGNIYAYGIRYIKAHHDMFFSRGLDKIEAYSTTYTPNPFMFQYDLTMFIWLNYYKILKQEITILKGLHIKDQEKQYDQLAEHLSITNKLYGIERIDFLFMAGELRWPTNIGDDGSHRGLFIRDPWSERRARGWSDEKFKYVFSFGGGGQGKTHVSLAIALMIFDYFLFTQKGARCMISTVNEDKMDSVPWPYLCNLNSSTQEGISITAGRAKIAGGRTLMRPSTKDKGGVFKGILIGNQMNKQSIIDKLTGSHGHPFICYVLDEMQSTPDPPISAAPNYTMHAKDFRIIGAGNWGENTDTLALNVKPDGGWDTVDESTGEWISTTQNGSKAIVLHFNNNLSPGITKEGSTTYPHLPSEAILNKNYPDKKKRNMSNIAYRRFWVGFRVTDLGESTVINEEFVKENLAHLPLTLDRVTHTFFSFDSAQAELDRNLCTVCREGICSLTKQRVFGPDTIYPLKKSTESTQYYKQSANQLYEIAMKNRIQSGNAVVDWTGRPAQAEMLQEKGFIVLKMIYNKGVPDGIRRDKHTNKIEKAIRLNIQLDFKDDLPPEKVCAHHVAENLISLGAWALREYIKAGRVRGINDKIVAFMNKERSLEDELFNRKFYLKNSATYGSRFQLESKDEFKKTYGFSPDLLDTLFQAAYYMLVKRNLPLTSIGVDDTVNESEDNDSYVGHNEIWETDLIYE